MTLPPLSPTATNRLRLVALALLTLSVGGIPLRAQTPVDPAKPTDHPAPVAPLSNVSSPTPDAVLPATVEKPAVAPGAAVPSPSLGSRGKTLSADECQGLLNLGASLTERSDYVAAEIAYRQILAGHPAPGPTKSALIALAHMYRKQGELTKAAAVYNKFLEVYPDDDRVPDALLDLGRTLRSLGASKLALSRFYSVINSTLKLPASSGFEHYQLLAKTAQFEIAETHFQNGEFAEATKFFSRLRMLDLAPVDRARAHFMSAFSLYRAQDFTGAASTLRAFLDQSPEDKNAPEAWYLLSMSLRSLKRPQEALTATLQLLRTEKARTAQDPATWNYWQRRTGNQLANDFFQGGDILNALAIYQSLEPLSSDPNWSIPVTYQVALCYERLGDVDRACHTYRDILDKLGSTPPPALVDIARMAATRLAQTAWRDSYTREVTALFTTTTGQKPPAPPALPDHDVIGSPSPAPAAL